MVVRFLHESSKIVQLRGHFVRKHEVQLGRLFVEDGRKFQAYADPCLYSSFKSGTFRRGDLWLYKEPKGAIVALKPNAPFGYPQGSANVTTLNKDEKVFVLKGEDRGPA